MFHETPERHNRGNNPAKIMLLLIAMAKCGTTKALGAGVELLGGELKVAVLVDMERNLVLAAPNLGC